MGKSRKVNSLQTLPLLAFISGMLTLSCEDERQSTVAGVIDPETSATMTTRDVETLISDSGLIRNKVVAPLWLMFDEAKDPHWKFPEGLHLERFDENFIKEATVDCDSAIYFNNKQLWRLDGNVRVVNIQGEKFLTQQLFWDQKREEVYSDSFIHIDMTDRMIEGYGFTSNSQMTKYKVNNVMAILPIEDPKPMDEEPYEEIEVIEEPDSIGPDQPKKKERRQPTPKAGVDAGEINTDTVAVIREVKTTPSPRPKVKPKENVN